MKTFKMGGEDPVVEREEVEFVGLKAEIAMEAINASFLQPTSLFLTCM